ncbi:MAG TPA: hypothetical protein VIU62_02550, partial [Chloroflexota bacterium]
MQITFEIPEAILHNLLDGVPIPDMATVRYRMQTSAPIDDMRAAVARQVRQAQVSALIKPGQRIAIGVGS